MKNLVTAGCSFTLDNYQKTWANFLSEKLGYKLTNIAARGAGIDFVFTRLLFQLHEYNPDLVVLMLPSMDRFDWYVDKEHLLVNEAKSIASWQNGKNPTLVDVDGQLNDNSGFSLTGGNPRGYKKSWFKYYHSESFAMLNYWRTVIGIQSFLQAKQVPYYITLAYDKEQLTEQPINITGYNNSYKFLHELCDWSRFIFYKDTKGFLSFTKDNNFIFNKNYPIECAHQQWVNDILIPGVECEN